MARTSIEWTEHSINPIRARDRVTGAVGHYCEKISSGCAHCYASTLQKRFKMPPFPGQKKPPTLAIGENGAVQVSDQIEVFLDESKLQEVLRRKKPTTYFWCDMTDLFGSWVPSEWIDKCFAVMALTSQHTHQVLTKRPERMAEYLVSHDVGLRWAFAAEGGQLPVGPGTAVDWTNHGLPNAWLGTSVENQEQAWRIDELRKCPAAVRFLSLEPLLSNLDLLYGPQDWGLLTGINWVIVGGESGSKARPCDVAWIRGIVAQCKAADVACFVKQLGSHPFCGECKDSIDLRRCDPCARGPWATTDRKGGNIVEFPEDLRVRQFPQTAQHYSS